MIGVDHGYLDVTKLLRTAFVHHAGLFCAFLLQPSAHFGNTDHLRVVLLDDFDGIANMVTVTVSDEKNIHVLYFFLGRRA